MSLGKSDENLPITENCVLKISITNVIPDRTTEGNLLDLDLLGFPSNPSMGLNDILLGLKNAKENVYVKGVLLDANFSPNSYATLEEIRNALIDFKKSGKFIIAYAEMMEEHSYYLASVADKIYLNPAGELFLRGFSHQTVYLKSALDKLGLKPELIRHGKFKAAGEPLISDRMSEENREQIKSYVGSLYHTFINKIASARKLNKDSTEQIVAHLQVRSALDAVQYKLIDGLKYEDQVHKEINKRMGKEPDSKLKMVGPDRLQENPEGSTKSKNKIAVVYFNGDIVSGQGTEESIGSDSYVATLQKIRRNETYKAVVLRINSPGGSALASDVIWREVELMRAKKPVLVSMGNVAASGGYYIGCNADTIVAQPNTITGSIGVFGLFLNAQELLNNKLGIHIETVKFGEYADLGSPDRPMTSAEKAIVQKEIDKVYTDFIQHVAAGRKLTAAQVDEIAQGRVWSGADALKIGLVDVIGGLDKTIEIAAKKANLSDYQIVELPELKDPFEQMMKKLTHRTQSYFVERELGENFLFYKEVKKALQHQGIQMRMGYEVRMN